MSSVNVLNNVVAFTGHRAKPLFWRTINRFRHDSNRTDIPPFNYEQVQELTCSRGKRMDVVLSTQAAAKIEDEIRKGNEVIVDGNRLIHALALLRKNDELTADILSKLHIIVEEPIVMGDLTTLFNCKKVDSM